LLIGLDKTNSQIWALIDLRCHFFAPYLLSNSCKAGRADKPTGEKMADPVAKQQQEEEDRALEQFKIKRLIRSLELARGYVKLRIYYFVVFYCNCAIFWRFTCFCFYGADSSFSSLTCDSNGTSMISLIIPPKEEISRISGMLADEYGTASNIKNRVNRYYWH